MINQIEPSFGQEEITALTEYINSGGWGTEHKKTEEFEQAICSFAKVKYCCAVPSGTLALILALLAIDLKPDDEVITTPLTMVATVNAPMLLGARIKFVDVEKDTLCLDVEKTIDELYPDTKAVIYVSFNGRSGNIEYLARICRERKIYLIEDACQSLGSFSDSKMLGTFGDIGVYSLSPHKIISTGQGGLIVTNNEILYKKVKQLKDFGRLKGGTDWHEEFGINAKFTDFQAVIGLEQLKKLPERIQRKRQIYELYRKNLQHTPMCKLPRIETDHTPWMVDIYNGSRDILCNWLKRNNVQTREMYPLVTKQPYCKTEAWYTPIAQQYSTKGFWLPSSCSLTDNQIKEICEQITYFYEQTNNAQKSS